MIPKLDSPETLRVLAGVAGGMKNLHLLLQESGLKITYTTLSKYISNGVQFEESVFANLFKTIGEKKSFLARETMRNLEDTYIVLNAMIGQGVFLPRKMGEAGELDEGWEKTQALTKEEIKDLEAEYGVNLSDEQKQVLQGKRRKTIERKQRPKSSVSVDDLFGDDEKAKEETEDFPQPESKKEERSKSFLEDFLNDENESEPPRNVLTDPFEAELQQSPDVFTSEDHRF